MQLWVTRPDSSGEFERDEVHEVADEAAADALLRTLPRGWYEATLRGADPKHDDGARPTRRRFLRSGWVDVLWWPKVATRAALPSFEDDARAISEWLRAMGVRLTWAQLLRAPWPGRQRGDVCAATCCEPDHTLRIAKRKGRRPVEALVGLIEQDGLERGALLHRANSNADMERRMLRETLKENDDLRRELRDARNEARRLRGEPEVTEEQEHAAARAAIRERLDARAARE